MVISAVWNDLQLIFFLFGTRIEYSFQKKWFKDLSVYREGEKIDLSALKTSDFFAIWAQGT